MIGILACGSAHTLRFTECFVFLSVILLPIAFGIVLWMAKDNPVWPENRHASFGAGNTPVKYGNWLFPLIAFTVLLVGVSLLANEWLDKSPAEPKTYVIVSKYTQTRKGGEYYFINILNPVDPPLFFLDFGDLQPLRLDKKNYELVMPNSSQVTISIHRGFFNLPWRETTYSLSNLNAH